MTTTTTELRAQLAKIDVEATALQSKLQLLIEKRQSILRRLDAVIYPVLTLPSDVTAEIFMHYLGNFLAITYNHALKTYPPLLLASVCKAWRSVALSFPRLWATLKLEWDPKTVVRREKLLRCWLLRAGGCLLDLDLSDSDLTESTSISAAIVQYAPQLRKLTLKTPPLASQLSSASGGAQLFFPALQTLTVDFTELSNETVITVFGDAPRLREVCMSGDSASFINLPWNQLTRLELNDVAPAREVLEQTPNLEVLSFHAELDFIDDHLPVVMKNLHTLRIDPRSSSWGLLHFLTVPALKTLELGYPVVSDLDSLLSMVSRSSCAIQVMHLHDHTAEELMDSLRLFESLEHLTIQFGIDWGREVLGPLQVRLFPNRRPIFPAYFPMAIDAALLTSMLNSRRQSYGVANLESFKLTFKHPAQQGYEEVHVSELRALVDHGLSIHIEWPTGPSKNVNPEMVEEEAEEAEKDGLGIWDACLADEDVGEDDDSERI
ncbi:hypothetical protein C8J57DRAFT_1719195 [Mycena rebaudengoi]|nr:hypothetical protein C8J57DRAFT_1719195 [Mycena rebaudengoi]